MKLHYLANLFATKHYVGSALGLHSRRLQLDQAEAANRVEDAVNTALSSVENGDVTGVAIALNYVALGGGDQRLAVNLRLTGVDRNQNMMVDTGSSALAFCNNSLAEEATGISKVNYAQCNTYGEKIACPDNNLTGSNLFYVGQIYQGDVGIYSNQGEEIASMDNVSFAIMEKEQMATTCDSVLDGIFGVSHTVGNSVNFLASGFDAMSLWNEYCKKPDLGIGSESVGMCNTENQTTLPAPLEATLAQAVESGYTKDEAFGLYLDYAATIGSTEDTIVPSLGAYFGGNLALNNQFYNNGNAQVSKQVTNNCQEQGKGSPLSWYLLNFTSIRAPGLNMTQSTTELCQECASITDSGTWTISPKCYTDSGTSSIYLPLPEEFCNSLPSDADELRSLGSLYIDLDGGASTLSLPLLWLKEQVALGYVECTETSGDFVLGLPISQYYYIAYDMGNKTVTFVDLELSDETESFIDGPELGGSGLSAGYLLSQAFTTGILVLTASCIYLWH